MAEIKEAVRGFLTVDYGDGYGDGYGYGDGSGYGYGYGYGVKEFNKDPVHMIDGIATIIKAVFGNYAKGYILNKDLTLSTCYIAKEGQYFAHGDTLADAVRDAHEKAFDGMDEDERIEEFWKCHEKDVKYPAMDFYDWHHRLTGSCEAGRKSFAANNGVNLETDTYTVEEFVKICKNSYGGGIIRRLLEEEN